MSARKKLARFLEQIASAPEGSNLELGLVYDADRGWRAYERINQHAIMLTPKQARKLAAIYESVAARTEWKGVATGLEWVPGMLRDLADEAEHKNKERFVPPEFVAEMPAMGTASASL
ncbi:MAG: hypothetical protein IT537_08650 [Hyphomicrobiales bacterium]|nr:hypothetical protein [Hyphomicrobiales bacterium]